MNISLIFSLNFEIFVSFAKMFRRAVRDCGAEAAASKNDDFCLDLMDTFSNHSDVLSDDDGNNDKESLLHLESNLNENNEEFDNPQSSYTFILHHILMSGKKIEDRKKAKHKITVIWLISSQI